MKYDWKYSSSFTHSTHHCQSRLPLLAFSLIVISSSECFFLILCAFSGQPDKLVHRVINDNFRWENITKLTNLSINRDCEWEWTCHCKDATCRPAVLFRDKMEDRRPHLLWVANTLLACPRPLQPGKGQWGSSCLLAFQAKGSPLMDDSFCLLAASGQLPALRWDVYFPDIWPCPSHPNTGHLPEKQTVLRVVNLHFVNLNIHNLYFKVTC